MKFMYFDIYIQLVRFHCLFASAKLVVRDDKKNVSAALLFIMNYIERGEDTF